VTLAALAASAGVTSLTIDKYRKTFIVILLPRVAVRPGNIPATEPVTPGMIAQAFRLAEEEGKFRVNDVSPVEAAAHIHVPVLRCEYISRSLAPHLRRAQRTQATAARPRRASQ